MSHVLAGLQSIPFGLAARVRRALVGMLALQSFHVLAAWLSFVCPLGSLVRIGGGRCSVSFPSHLRRRLACGCFLSTSLRLASGTLSPKGSSLAAGPRRPLGSHWCRPPPGFPGCHVDFPQGKDWAGPHTFSGRVKCFWLSFGPLLCGVLTLYK